MAGLTGFKAIGWKEVKSISSLRELVSYLYEAQDVVACDAMLGEVDDVFEAKSLFDCYAAGWTLAVSNCRLKLKFCSMGSGAEVCEAFISGVKSQKQVRGSVAEHDFTEEDMALLMELPSNIWHKTGEEDDEEKKSRKAKMQDAAKKGRVLVKSRNILITGPGGAGKSCLVRIMSGEEPLEPYNSTGVFDEARRVASFTMICQTPSEEETGTEKKFTLLKGNALLKLMACGATSHKNDTGQSNAVGINGTGIHDQSASVEPSKISTGLEAPKQPVDSEPWNASQDSEMSKQSLGSEPVSELASSEFYVHPASSEASNRPSDFATSPGSKTPNQPPDSEIDDIDPETSATIEEFLSEVAEYLENHPTDPKIAEVDLFYIIDSGGQLQFHEMLHQFVSKIHCTVYVTNVNDQPTDPVLDQFYVDGKAEGIPYKSQYTHEQLFKRSLQALQLQTSVDKKIASHKPASTESAAGDTKSTKLAVVATHKDKAKKDALEKKHKWVVDITTAAGINDEDIVYAGNLDEPVYALDASSLSKSQEPVNKFLEILRDKVSFKKEEIPLGRFILEEMMRKAAEESSGIVSIAKCREIGHLVEMSPESVEKELQNLSNHNRILYNKDVSEDIVFCDVQTPLSVLKQLAQYSALARNDPELKSANISEDTISDLESLLELLKMGTLTEEVLSKNAASFFQHGFTAKIFLKLMKNYQIIAKQCSQEEAPKEQEQDRKDVCKSQSKIAKDQKTVPKDQVQSHQLQVKYFMPCILPEAPGSVLQECRASDVEPNRERSRKSESDVELLRVEPFLLYFGEWPEAGKFCTLVARLVSQKWEPKPFLPKKYLYRNCIRFSVKEPRCSIILIESYYCGYFEVHISLPEGESAEQASVICPKVRQTLYDALSADVKPQDAFICSISACDYKKHMEKERQSAEEKHLENKQQCDADIARILLLEQQQQSRKDAKELTDLKKKLNDVKDAKKAEEKRYVTEITMLEEEKRHAAVFDEDDLLQCTKDTPKTQRLKKDDKRYVWCPEKMSSVKQEQQCTEEAKKQTQRAAEKAKRREEAAAIQEQKRHAEEARQKQRAAEKAKRREAKAIQEQKRHAEEARQKQRRNNLLRHVVYGLLLAAVVGVVLWYTTELPPLFFKTPDSSDDLGLKGVWPSSQPRTIDVHIKSLLVGPLADARPSSSDLVFVPWSGAGGMVEEFRLKDHIIGSCKELGSVFGLTAALTQSLCPDPDSCCDNVLGRWARGSIDNRASYPYTWRGLVKALQAANLHQPASHLAQALNNRATDS